MTYLGLAVRIRANTTQSHDAVSGNRSRQVGKRCLYSDPGQHQALKAVAGEFEKEESSESEPRPPESLASGRCHACNATNKVCSWGIREIADRH